MSTPTVIPNPGNPVLPLTLAWENERVGITPREARSLAALLIDEADRADPPKGDRDLSERIKLIKRIRAEYGTGLFETNRACVVCQHDGGDWYANTVSLMKQEGAIP